MNSCSVACSPASFLLPRLASLCAFSGLVVSPPLAQFHCHTTNLPPPLPACPTCWHVQQAFSAVKAEMRELLAKHHVTQMTMKPVKRQYAFENPAVRHGQQWVLKASASNDVL